MNNPDPVEYQNRLQGRGELPLLGKCVLLTTPRSYAGGLVKLLTERGARPVWMPTIEIWPLDDYRELDEAISHLGDYGWVLFTSINGIEAFAKRCIACGVAPHSLIGVKIAAFDADAIALHHFGIKADLIPPRPSPKSLIDELLKQGLGGKRILVPVPRVKGVPEPYVIPEFISELKKAKAAVHRVPAYETVTVAPAAVEDERKKLLAGDVEVIAMTSSAEIFSLLQMVGNNPGIINRAVLAYMGSATARTGKEAGLKLDIIPEKPAMAGLVEAIEGYYKKLSAPETISSLKPARSDYRWPTRLDVVAMSGVGVEIVKSWSSILQLDTGMAVHIAVEDDAVSKFKWVKSGLFHLTASAPAETAQMLIADRRYAVRDGGPFPVRVVWTHTVSNSGFFVRGDSKLRQIYDVSPGTRIADISSYLAGNRMVEAFLAWAKIDRSEIEWIPCRSFKENVSAVVEGRADLSFGVPNSPLIFEAERNQQGLRWLVLDPEKDPEGARRFRSVSPLIRFGRVRFGVPSSIGVCTAFGTSLYVTRAQTDVELVYNLAKWLDDNHSRYRDKHPWNREATMDALLEELGHTFRPCHDGLIRYLWEKHLWTPALEKRQEENVALINQYCRVYQDAMEEADRRALRVEPGNSEWAALWGDLLVKSGLPPVTNRFPSTLSGP